MRELPIRFPLSGPATQSGRALFVAPELAPNQHTAWSGRTRAARKPGAFLNRWSEVRVCMAGGTDENALKPPILSDEGGVGDIGSEASNPLETGSKGLPGRFWPPS